MENPRKCLEKSLLQEVKPPARIDRVTQVKCVGTAVTEGLTVCGEDHMVADCPF